MPMSWGDMLMATFFDRFHTKKAKQELTAAPHF